MRRQLDRCRESPTEVLPRVTLGLEIPSMKICPAQCKDQSYISKGI